MDFQLFFLDQRKKRLVKKRARSVSSSCSDDELSNEPKKMKKVEPQPSTSNKDDCFSDNDDAKSQASTLTVEKPEEKTVIKNLHSFLIFI